jgi:hypothetical protein
MHPSKLQDTTHGGQSLEMWCVQEFKGEVRSHPRHFSRLIRAMRVSVTSGRLRYWHLGILTGSNIDYSQRVMGKFPPEETRD